MWYKGPARNHPPKLLKLWQFIPQMGDVINLRRTRKAKVREVAGMDAEANRLKFGQTKVARRQRAQEDARAKKSLAQHELDAPRPKR